MWIVELALRRPYTFVVVSMLIALLGVLSATSMAIDIFPQINIPVVSVIWSYSGLSPADFESRIVTISERAMTTVTSEIAHLESNSVNGIGIIKVYLRQGTDVGKATALMSSVNQTILKILPPGITPPLVTAFSTSDVPVMQLGVNSKTLSESELYDYGLSFIRPRLATAGGCSVPIPYGGKSRQVMVDINTAQLNAKGLSANDVANALNLQNLILPAGSAKIGSKEYQVRMNSSPMTLEEMNSYPIKQVNNATIFFKDIGNVHDGFATQTNIVNQNGHRSTMLNILRSGSASTLAVVNNIKASLPALLQTLPKELNIEILTDQSIFVKAAIKQVVSEAVTAATLTGLLMLAILGSWRSTLIVAISIPLSILASIIGLNISGQTLNTMTLGGLALSVGMLVDDATVEVENIHRNLAMKKPIVKAILDGAAQIAAPAFVSTLAICLVFVPVTLLTEPARSLFVPLGMAVVYAMLASYFLSRTLVPVMARYLLHEHEDEHEENPGFFRKIYLWIDTHFNNFRDRYHKVLESALQNRAAVIIGFLLLYAGCLSLIPFVGQDFFPRVDGGQLRLHVVAPKGSRIEETEQEFKRVEAGIRTIIPADEIKIITQNFGLPTNGINLAYGDNITFSDFDGEILVSLNPDHKGSAFVYEKQIRKYLREKMPEIGFFFQPADITSQILNAGLPAPIDIQVSGRNMQLDYDLALQLQKKIALIPGAVDVILLQVPDAPQINVDVNRSKAMELGLTQRDVANSVLISLSSSFQTQPNYWVNPKNGVNYNVAVETPTYQINKMDDIATMPITSSQKQTELLTNLAKIGRSTTPAVISHYQIMPVFDIYVNTQDRDLGGVAGDARKIVDDFRKTLPRGCFVALRGQADSMNIAFGGLLNGLVFALVLVYMLLVINFQSWLDPLIILMASPGALSGVVLMLFLTQTTFSVPALMGAIMSIGVASANSILMVTFAEEQRQAGHKPVESASAAGFTRFRPVIMTASAMIIGMLPMATGLGEGGSANAPLGRAVIGGLLVATFATLFFVPMVFAVLKKPAKSNADNR
ncbi:MAG TPA: efflux RND transporter permease subunit [Planktothrix sp.]|jgi:multidrug efflux pump subunit AcrB